MAALPGNSVTINTLDFARKALEIHDTIAVSHFSRLADFLGDSDGNIDYRLTGYLADGNKPGLALHIAGKLNLVCQRCLGPMTFDLDLDARFMVVRDEASIPEDDDEVDEVDYLVAETHMPVSQLVEDEILLSLPMAPKHAPEACRATTRLDESNKAGPFAELEKLRLRGSGTGESQN